MLNRLIKTVENITAAVINRPFSFDHNIDASHKTHIDSSNYASFAAAVLECGPAGSPNCTLYVTKTEVISTAQAVLGHIKVVATNGGKFKKSGSGTISIVYFEAGHEQVFDGFDATDVVLGLRTPIVYSTWFGGTGDDPVNKAIRSLEAAGGEVWMDQSLSGPTIAGYRGVSLIGTGRDTSIYTLDNTSDTSCLTYAGGTAGGSQLPPQHCRVENIWFDANLQEYGIDLTASANHLSFSNVRIKNFLTAGLFIETSASGGSVYHEFYNLYITNNTFGAVGTGILMQRTDASTQNSNHNFYGTVISACVKGVDIGNNVFGCGFWGLDIEACSSWGITNDGTSNSFSNVNFDGLDFCIILTANNNLTNIYAPVVYSATSGSGNRIQGLTNGFNNLIGAANDVESFFNPGTLHLGVMDRFIGGGSGGTPGLKSHLPVNDDSEYWSWADSDDVDRMKMGSKGISLDFLADDSLSVSKMRTVNGDMADDAVITVSPAAKGGWGVATSEDGDSLMFSYDSAFTVTAIVSNGNVAVTDSDTDLCVFDGGTTLTLKNRLGATKRITLTLFGS